MNRKSGFWSVYKDFWNRKWDFKGTSTLREYWLPTALHLGILALAAVIYLLFTPRGWSPAAVILCLLLLYLFIMLIPSVALTVRRIRETGLSGVWALLLLFVGAGTFVVLALCAAGKGFPPEIQPSVALYGPPPIEKTSFSPSENVTPTLYGPPVTQPQKEEEESETEAETATTFDPSNNTAAPLYGPPPSENR